MWSLKPEWLRTHLRQITASIVAAIERYWYSDNVLSRVLQPLGVTLAAAARLRHGRYLERVAAGKLWRPPVPVIVVGNISVGGTGKTPVVVALVEHLAALGYRPGVVSRGYGGRPRQLPLEVTGQTAVAESGDESLLIRMRTGCPVVVDPDRTRAVRHILAETNCDVIISDDGLQHYALYRDVEIAVVDGERGLGNGRCLPAGPLREGPSRLAAVDGVLVNGGGRCFANAMCYDFFLKPAAFVNLRSGQRLSPEDFPRQPAVHAVAGIGNPQRFFTTLRELGFDLRTHEFSDHFKYEKQNIEFKDNKRVIMTEKDAVKCLEFASDQHWYLAVDGQLPPLFLQWLEQKLQTIN